VLFTLRFFVVYKQGSQDSVDKLLGDELKKYHIKRTEDNGTNYSKFPAGLSDNGQRMSRDSGRTNDRSRASSSSVTSNTDHLTIIRGQSTERLGGVGKRGNPYYSSAQNGERLSNYAKEYSVITRSSDRGGMSDVTVGDHNKMSHSEDTSSRMMLDIRNSTNNDEIVQDGGQAWAMNGSRFPRRQLFGYGGNGCHDYVNINYVGNVDSRTSNCDSSACPTNQQNRTAECTTNQSRAMSKTESMNDIGAAVSIFFIFVGSMLNI